MFKANQALGKEKQSQVEKNLSSNHFRVNIRGSQRHEQACEIF